MSVGIESIKIIFQQEQGSTKQTVRYSKRFAEINSTELFFPIEIIFANKARTGFMFIAVPGWFMSVKIRRGGPQCGPWWWGMFRVVSVGRSLR